MMLDQGAIEEVRDATNFSVTCEKAIGVPQIRAYLAGEMDLASCEEKIFFATCQYAKRQRTWFNKESWLTPLAYRTIERVLCELDQCGEVIPDTVVTTLDAPAPTPTLNYCRIKLLLSLRALCVFRSLLFLRPFNDGV